MDLENMRLDEKRNLADSPNTSEDVLQTLAKDTQYTVRYRVAHNRSTPETALRELAKDLYGGVREEVAANPSTPEDILRELVQDNDTSVRYWVAGNPKASNKILIMLFKYEKSFREPNEYVIRALYENKNLPHIVKVIIETLFKEML